jgi:hypothetical protein
MRAFAVRVGFAGAIGLVLVVGQAVQGEPPQRAGDKTRTGSEPMSRNAVRKVSSEAPIAMSSQAEGIESFSGCTVPSEAMVEPDNCAGNYPMAGVLVGGCGAGSGCSVGQFNCQCRGSYKYPVPPQYTYHWPGIYSQQTMTGNANYQTILSLPLGQDAPASKSALARKPSALEQVKKVPARTVKPTRQYDPSVPHMASATR